MGRGRNGITDQSMIKPKVRKYKERGPNFEIFHSPYVQENHSVLVSEGLLAEMKKMSPQDLMNILLPNQSEQDH